MTSETFDQAGQWLRGSGLEIVLLVLGAVLVTRLAAWTRDTVVASIDARDSNSDALVRSEAAKHRHSLTQVLTWVVLVMIYTLTAVMVLQRLGILLTGLVAPATVAGVALGFGARSIVQDVLAGFFIIAERQYGFGDLVDLATVGVSPDASGTVEDVTLRVTRLRSIDGEIIIVPNGQIARASNLSRDWARAVIDIPLPITVDLGRATRVLQDAGRAAYADPDLSRLLLDAPTVMGVEQMDVDAFRLRVVARSLPGKQFVVTRDLRTRLANALAAEGVVTSDGDAAATPAARP